MSSKKNTFLLAGTCLGLAAMISLSTPAAAQMAGEFYSSHTPVVMNQTYDVDLNKTRVLHLPERASAVVVGNPAIADVSIHSDNTIFLIGRGYGETNVMVLNASGKVVIDSTIQVTHSLPSNGVRVFNGGAMNRNTYSCAPYCQPAPVLGDSGDFRAINSGEQVLIRNTVAGTSLANQTSQAGAQFAPLQSAEEAAESGISDPGSAPDF